MKKKVAVLFALSLLCISLTAYADSYSMLGFVNASTSDRVHLRSAPRSDAPSLGLYFTGTPVINLWGGNDQWMEVMIGSEKGYMYKKMLVDATEEHNPSVRWKQAVVHASGWVNLRSAPSLNAPIVSKVPDESTVAVLGETKDRWCYVKVGNAYGYIMSRYLKVSKDLYHIEKQGSLPLPICLPAQCYFSSGAGAWSTQMVILPDGSFWGYYHDADMGINSDKYPKGTLYECSFTGTFSDIRRINETEYQMKVDCVQDFGIKNSETVYNDTLVITTGSYGLANKEIFSVFLPGTPHFSLPEEYLWQYVNYAVDHKKTIGLFGHSGQAAWVID